MTPSFPTRCASDLHFFRDIAEYRRLAVTDANERATAVDNQDQVQRGFKQAPVDVLFGQRLAQPGMPGAAKQVQHGGKHGPWSGGGDAADHGPVHLAFRLEEHTSELTSLMRTSYADICLINQNLVDTQKQIQRH